MVVQNQSLFKPVIQADFILTQKNGKELGDLVELFLKQGFTREPHSGSTLIESPDKKFETYFVQLHDGRIRVILSTKMYNVDGIHPEYPVRLAEQLERWYLVKRDKTLLNNNHSYTWREKQDSLGGSSLLDTTL